MRYHFRTLVVLLIVGPPTVAALYCFPVLTLVVIAVGSLFFAECRWRGPHSQR